MHFPNREGLRGICVTKKKRLNFVNQEPEQPCDFEDSRVLHFACRSITLVFQNPPVIPCEDRYLDPLKAEPQEMFMASNTDPHKVWLED